MNEQEPIDTSTPWHRTRREPLTQVEGERAVYELAARKAMMKPGNGTIHPMSITTPTYEPNRAMAPDSQSIIGKKGLRPTDINGPLTKGDKFVIGVVVFCLVLIAIVIGAIIVKLR